MLEDERLDNRSYSGVRYDAHSGIAVLHGVGILEKGNQMAEPTSCIVEMDEQGNTSINEDRGTGIRDVFLCVR